MRVATIIAASLLAAAAQAPAANLIVNGGFETPGTSPGGFVIYNGGDSFGGWTVTGATVGTVNTTYAESGIVFNAGEGSTSLDIAGPGNTGPQDGVFQAIATRAGKTYRLNFLLGNADGSANNVYLGDSLIGVSVGGGVETIFTNSAITTQGINWAARTLTFVAAGTSTNILFRNATPTNDNFTGLDAVSVEAVPEPATWGLMLAGFGMVGFAMRRRTARTVLA